MVTFSQYVALAYEVTDEKGLSVNDPNSFMSDLATVYRENNHSQAGKSAAKDYLRRVVN